ncbi:hypothetical protein GCM10023192_63120 [Amycolatopsis samaneae]
MVPPLPRRGDHETEIADDEQPGAGTEADRQASCLDDPAGGVMGRPFLEHGSPELFLVTRNAEFATLHSPNPEMPAPHNSEGHPAAPNLGECGETVRLPGIGGGRSRPVSLIRQVRY